MALLNVVTYKYSFRALALLFFAGSSLFTFIKYMYAILGKVGVGGGVGAVCKTHYIWVLLCLGFNFIFCQQHIEIHIYTSFHHFALLDVVFVKHWVGKNDILLFERSHSNSPEKEKLEPWPCTIYSLTVIIHYWYKVFLMLDSLIYPTVNGIMAGMKFWFKQ